MSFTWSGEHSSLRTTAATSCRRRAGQEVRDAHSNSSQQFRDAASFLQLSTPRAPLSFAPLPGGARRNTERGALGAGAVGRGR